MAGNKVRSMLLISFLSIFLLGVVSFLLWKMYDDSGTEVAVKAEDLLEWSMETEEITTNLHSSGYVQVKFLIQADSSRAKEELLKRNFQVRRVIIKTAASMTAEDLNGAQGISQLEETIRNELNEIMQNGKVIHVFTTKKLLQQ